MGRLRRTPSFFYEKLLTVVVPHEEELQLGDPLHELHPTNGTIREVAAPLRLLMVEDAGKVHAFSPAHKPTVVLGRDMAAARGGAAIGVSCCCSFVYGGTYDPLVDSPAAVYTYDSVALRGVRSAKTDTEMIPGCGPFRHGVAPGGIPTPGCEVHGGVTCVDDPLFCRNG